MPLIMLLVSMGLKHSANGGSLPIMTLFVSRTLLFFRLCPMREDLLAIYLIEIVW